MRQIIFSLLGLATVLNGQQITDSRSAEIKGGGGDGKCTIEVEVDDVAEVEILGSRAQIRTLAGSPARFVRFVCNQAMPTGPNDFRFEGIDGRGRQTLVRQPGGRTPAVVRIEDSKGGREGYTFDIMWRGGSNMGGGGFNDGGFGNGNNGNNRPGWGNDRELGTSRPGYGNNRNNGNNGNNGNNRPGWGNDSGTLGNNNGNWNREMNFRGRGTGEFRSGRGRTDRLSDCNVTISRQGDMEVRFDTNRRSSVVLNGRVLRQENGRLFADMSGNGVSGEMVIDFDNRDRVTSVAMSGNGRDRFDLRWRN